MLRTTLTTAILALIVFPAEAQSIAGSWRTQSGETAQIARCGGGAYCITLRTGKHKGRRIGRMTGKAAN